jgi:PAS domain S-box-containing protein
VVQENAAFAALLANGPKAGTAHFDDFGLTDVRNHRMDWNDWFAASKTESPLTQRLGIKQQYGVRFHQTEAYYYNDAHGEFVCLLVKPRTPEEYADEVDEEHLMQVVDEFPTLMCAWDDLGNFRFWNRECERVFGYPKAEIVGNPDGMAYLYPDPGERAKIMSKWGKRQQVSRIRDWELEVTCKDGSKRIISWTIQYDSESFMGFHTWGIGVDVTDKVQARKVLEINEKRYNIISKATNDAVWDWDLLTNDLFWNDGITNLFGHPDEQIEKCIDWWENNIHPEDRERVASRIHDFVERGQDFWWDEYRFRRQDDSYAFVYDKGHIIKDPEGKPVRMIGGILDITERKVYEQNLVLKNHQIAEYVFHNSHRVRAPLARLMGLAQLLAEHHPDVSESKEMIEKIRAAADEIEHLTRAVSNIML